jgi:HEAT repeat protein
VNDANHLVNSLSDPSLSLPERLEALAQLVAEKATGCIGSLGRLLNDEAQDMDFRCSVAMALGCLGEGLAGLEAIGFLATQGNHANPLLRQTVMQALGESQNLEAATFIIKGLQDESDQVFGAAAEALGRLGSPMSPVLCALLETGKDDVRCVAAWQLGELAGKQAVPLLVEKARNDSNPDVQALCLWALGEIGLHTPEVLQVILWAKEQENPEIRLRAETAIKKVVRHAN